MQLYHLARKMFLQLSSEGLKSTLKELIYFNRIMVAIEKDLRAEAGIMKPTMHKIIVDRQNYFEYRNKFNIKNVLYYCRRGAQCLLLFDGKDLLGYQLWTYDSEFSDLRKLGIRMKKGEAYLFDLFVYPPYRGTVVPKIVAIETHNYLLSQGINKIFGFYFKDNIKALWWHKAYLKCKEIKRVPTNRILIFEFTKGKISFKV